MDEAGRGGEAEAADLLEDGGGLLETAAVHEAPGEVGHLPVHPGHLRAHVSAQLQGRRILIIMIIISIIISIIIVIIVIIALSFITSCGLFMPRKAAAVLVD